MRSSSACSGSNSRVSTSLAVDARPRPWRRRAPRPGRPPRETGRFSGSSTRKEILRSSGSTAPRQRRGRNGLIGVSATSFEPKRQDRAVGGEIVGGRAGRRRHQHAVADQLGQHDAAVHRDLDPGGLAGFAEQRDLVDRMVDDALAVDRSVAFISSGATLNDLGPREPLGQRVEPPLVHQEADRAAVHPEDRADPAAVEHLVQRLQQEAVAAQRDDQLGLVRSARNRSACAASPRPPAPLRRGRRPAPSSGSRSSAMARS